MLYCPYGSNKLLKSSLRGSGIERWMGEDNTVISMCLLLEEVSQKIKYSDENVFDLIDKQLKNEYRKKD